MHMVLSHARDTYFMSKWFTKSNPQWGHVGQTMTSSQLIKAKLALTDSSMLMRKYCVFSRKTRRKEIN